jgi:hypothetical protein
MMSFLPLPSLVRAGANRSVQSKEKNMPRYVVEREFAAGLVVPINDEGAKACLKVVETNLTDGVTWIQSYVSVDKKKSYCVYDGPNPEAIRRVAGKTNLPVSDILEVRVLDPYFYS